MNISVGHEGRIAMISVAIRLFYIPSACKKTIVIETRDQLSGSKFSGSWGMKSISYCVFGQHW